MMKLTYIAICGTILYTYDAVYTPDTILTTLYLGAVAATLSISAISRSRRTISVMRRLCFWR